MSSSLINEPLFDQSCGSSKSTPKSRQRSFYSFKTQCILQTCSEQNGSFLQVPTLLSTELPLFEAIQQTTYLKSSFHSSVDNLWFVMSIYRHIHCMKKVVKQTNMHKVNTLTVSTRTRGEAIDALSMGFFSIAENRE